MKKNAFLNLHDEDKKFDITYYHNPKHWIENRIDSNNPITDESKEILLGLMKKIGEL